MTHKRLGIIKGGQLALMMLPACKALNVDAVILDDDTKAPTHKLAHEFHVGSAQNKDDVYAFGQKVDALTFEFENINTDALDQLKQEELTIFPDPDIIRLVQDKGLQKQFYQDHHIPTSDFVLVNNREELAKHESLFPAVQKLRTSGYDGKGVTCIASPEDDKAFDALSVLEKQVDIAKEISVLVVRSQTGEMKTYPVVEMVMNHEANMLDYLFAPAAITDVQSQEAIAIAEDLVNKLNHVGILAVEMFIDQEGVILVNEIAPRPHNSGHHTIEANITSQFENHVRAILGLPLGDVTIHKPAVMLNLIGCPGHSGPAQFEGLDELDDNVYVHLYNKEQTRPFRKMGHVTILDDSIDNAKQHAHNIKEKVKVIACNQ